MGAVFFLIVMSVSAWAVPTSMNYQGKLTDKDGKPLNGSYNMTFYLFTLPSGGSAIWTENHPSVQVTDGIYNIELGGLTQDLFENNELYLEVEVGGETLEPRQHLTSSAYSMRAADADTLDGKDSTEFSESTHGHAFGEITGTATDSQIPNDITIDYAATSAYAYSADSATTAGSADYASTASDADTVDGYDAIDFAGAIHQHSGGDITSGTVADARIATTIARDSEVMTIVKANDGAGSLVDADMLDGLQGSSYLSSSSDYGRSGVASNLYEGTSTLSNRYINDDSADTMQANTISNLFSAIQNGTGRAIYAESAGTKGIEGKATGTNGAGVSGYCYATGGIGVFGQGTLRGIYGYSSDYDGYGVVGEAPGASGEGVRGITSGNYGRAVVGEATYTGPTTTYGGHFTANSVNGRGVFGGTSGATGYGVFGWATATGAGIQNYGGYFRADGETGTGVYGTASNTEGDQDNYGIGVYGTAAGSHGRGVYGTASDRNGYGVYGSATSTEYTYNYGGYFRAYGEVGRGVVGRADGESATGVYGYALGTSSNGVYGHATGRSGIGVYAYAGGESGHAVYGWAPVSTAYAGYFNGAVYISGPLTKPGGSFQIDHPLDPENKYLNHSFVESPDMMNIYNGNVVLDATGQAWVELPEWFEALNKDYRYQLTCIGGFAQVYIAQEISDSRFKIAGGNPGMKVSWQVTGIRQDPWAEANRIPVEEDKAADERGFYLQPEAYGQPEEKGIEWGRNPEMMQRMKEEREKPVDPEKPFAG